MKRLFRKHIPRTIIWLISLTLLTSGVLFVWAATLQVPDLESIQARRIDQSLKLYDRTGTILLYDLSTDVRRTNVTIDQISKNVINATISIEDSGFYSHNGIRVRSIARAIFVDITSGVASQGGSTITQQVVKNTILTRDKTITRKLKEWILALKLEKTLSKSQILELYLNQVPYGGSMYGVEQASETFFGKHASDVTIAEAAYLAAVLPAPSFYSPYGTHKDRLDARKNLVLNKMYEHGYITKEVLDTEKAVKVVFVQPRESSIAAPHFVFYVQQYLEDKYGEDVMQRGGWSVTTTLNADLQIKAEEIVKAYTVSQEKNFNASNTGMVAIDPNNGQILTMVGSRNYFDTKIDGNFNIALAKRQPGSAFKPFAYAEAFSKGYTPNTVLYDVRTQFSTSCNPEDTENSIEPCYSPVNYDGKFRGPMTLRDALAQSINIPAIKVLYLAGIADTLRLAKAMGISTLGTPGQYGLTLVLGGGEVTLLDITSAYGTFAQDGVHYLPVAVLNVKDQSGNVIEDNSETVGTTVLSADVAQKINDILSDPVARAPLGANNLFIFHGYDVAVKTGTTNDYRDAWNIGYTPNIVVGMWAGNNNNTSMEKRVSGLIVGPMWSEFMRYALTKVPNKPFTRTEEDLSHLKSALRGDWQALGNDGMVHEILYWISKNDPAGTPPYNPANDPQYAYWEIPTRAWALQNGYK